MTTSLGITRISLSCSTSDDAAHTVCRHTDTEHRGPGGHRGEWQRERQDYAADQSHQRNQAAGPALVEPQSQGGGVGDRVVDQHTEGRKADRTDALIERCGLWAVVGQRFVPGISDAFASYAFGTFGVPLWQMAVGAFIGSAPRAFAYTALGAAIGDRSPLLASCAIAVWCVTAIIGAFAARHGYRQWRAHARGDGADGGVEDPDREVGAR